MLLRTLFTLMAALRRQRVGLSLFVLISALCLSIQFTPLEQRGRAQNTPARSNAPRGTKTAGASSPCCGPKTWAQKSTTGPSARVSALAYDQARMKTVLFGGHTNVGSGMDNQTWQWNGSTWTLASPTGTIPSARRYHSLAYDSQKQVTVLFGGFDNTSNFKGDTWEWNGTTWTQMSASGPSPRQHHSMAYDSQRHVTVLFGGHNNTGDFGDTWEWNSLTGVWTLKSSTGPSPRSDAAMAYDPVRNVTVLFGGKAATGGPAKGDTWEWNGTTWSLKTPAASPSPRTYHAMAYDGTCGGVLLFGGFNGIYLNDTWSWDGLTWTQKSGSAPAVRVSPGMAYDSARDAIVLFGGYDLGEGGVSFNFYGDTWEWSGSIVSPPDLWIKDTMSPDLPEDNGTEPTVSQVLFISRDIWVRALAPDTTVTSATNPGPDNTTLPAGRYYTNEHQHQDPVYATLPSYVYVKVRNRGCAFSAGTEKLRVYWANASTGLPWLSTGVWTEFDCVAGGGVDPCPLPVIAPGQDYVVELPWMVPNPGAYGGSRHFCLVARIETVPTPPFGMTVAEGTTLWANVANNNNIAWMNVTVAFASKPGGKVIVRNTLEREAALALRFAVPARELRNHFLLHGDIFVDLGEAIMEKWRRSGQRERGFAVVDKTTIRITDPANAELGGLLFSAGEEHSIEVRMQLKRSAKALAGTTFNWDVIQLAQSSKNARPSTIGGERYIFVVPKTREEKMSEPRMRNSFIVP